MSAHRAVTGGREDLTVPAATVEPTAEPRTDPEPLDLAVVNAIVITAQPADRPIGGVAVRDGRIARLLSPGERPPARRVLDAGGRRLLPGLIDSHVHFRTPGLTHKEDWEHGSRAAVAGGVTTVIDMPNTRPPLHRPAAAHERAALIEGRSLVDFRFHLGVDPDRPELLADASPAEATSAKAFLTGHHTAPDVVRGPERLALVFRHAAAAGLRLCLHAEDDGVLGLLSSARGTPASYREDERRRPRSGAIVAVARIIELVERFGVAAHVLHVSSADEVDLLTAAAEIGLPVSFEVTGHHLSFTAADAASLGARVRLSPSPRRAADREALWAAVLGGQATCLGSDHAPHTLREKLRPLAAAPPGLPGVQELLPAVLTGMRARRPAAPVDELLRQLTRLLAEAPADLFGLARHKGRLRPGLDADLVLLDVDTPWRLTADQVRSRCGWSAYQDLPMTDRVALTIRRGEVVYDARRRPVFGRPDGRFLTAEPVAA